VLFGLLVVAQIARLLAKGMHLLTEPVFLIATIVAIGACVWAAVLLKRVLSWPFSQMRALAAGHESDVFSLTEV
jgi:hypothetical protein